MVVADYVDYIAAQERAGQAFADGDRWGRMSILNAARIGRFSSDRTIREYADEIWKVRGVPIEL